MEDYLLLGGVPLRGVHLAAYKGQAEIVEYLLSRPDINIDKEMAGGRRHSL